MKSHEKRQRKTPTIFLTEYLMVLIPNMSHGWPGWKQLRNNILSYRVFFSFPSFCSKLPNLFRGRSPQEGWRDRRRSGAGCASSTQWGCVGAGQNCHPACRVLRNTAQTRSKKCQTELAKCSTPDRWEACMGNDTCSGLTITCVLTPVVDPARCSIGSNLKIRRCGWKLPRLGQAWNVLK